jgi:hypothetical protein
LVLNIYRYTWTYYKGQYFYWYNILIEYWTTVLKTNNIFNFTWLFGVKMYEIWLLLVQRFIKTNISSPLVRNKLLLMYFNNIKMTNLNNFLKIWMSFTNILNWYKGLFTLINVLLSNHISYILTPNNQLKLKMLFVFNTVVQYSIKMLYQ